MPAIYYHPLRVSSDEIDGQGHANNVVYVRWLQDAAVAHSTTQGWDSKRYTESGTSWVVRTHFVRYLSPAFEGDELMVQTWVANIQKVTSLRRYRLFRKSDGECLAQAETDWAFVSLERRRPTRIPVEFRDSFTIVEDESPAFAPDAF